MKEEHLVQFELVKKIPPTAGYIMSFHLKPVACGTDMDVWIIDDPHNIYLVLFEDHWYIAVVISRSII